MGFGDMKLFNKALLARQAWRLIQFPDSLCTRLLKAKYYPNGELVDKVFPSDTSPTWRSIAYGLELLKEGIVWHHIWTRIAEGRDCMAGWIGI
jgi:hypothetical protein